MRAIMMFAAGIVLTTAAIAQSGNQNDIQTGTQHTGAGLDRDSSDALAVKAETLLAQAQADPTGLATVTLKKYPGHYTMLTVRVKTGGAEMHADANDVFVVLDGEATIITGGTIMDAKTISPGETRGSRVEGGASTFMRKGDVIHIDPNTPHQTILAPGSTFTYYVIKIAAAKE